MFLHTKCVKTKQFGTKAIFFLSKVTFIDGLEQNLNWIENFEKFEPAIFPKKCHLSFNFVCNNFNWIQTTAKPKSSVYFEKKLLLCPFEKLWKRHKS